MIYHKNKEYPPAPPEPRPTDDGPPVVDADGIDVDTTITQKGGKYYEVSFL